MMRCQDVQELLGLYWDLPNNDLRRTAVDEHIRKCPACAEEFKIWEESTQLIAHSAIEEGEPAPAHSISASVMERIYAEESWRKPVAARAYSLSTRLRFGIGAVVGFCLIIFMTTFIYTVISDTQERQTYAFRPGVVPVMNAQSTGGSAIQTALHSEIPTASITAPLILDIGPAESFPDYLIVLSILGVIFSLLILNWLSRIRS